MNKNPIFLALAVVFWSAAQSFAQTPLQECSALELPEEKLECFEQLAAEEREAIAESFASPRVGAAPEKPATIAVARSELGVEQAAREAAPTSGGEPSDAVRQIKTAKQYARDGLVFQVSRSEKDGEQRQIFYMNSGQIWREIEPSSIYFPRGRQFDVAINKGMLGDYRLRVEGKGRFTRVIRLH